MPILNEPLRGGGFIVSEANGTRSRERGVLAAGNDLPAGAVLATVGGKYVALNPAADTGAEIATALLYDAVDATDGDQSCVVIVRDAEFDQAEIVLPAGINGPQTTTALGQLRALGLIAR